MDHSFNPKSKPSFAQSSITSPIPVPTYGPGGTFSIFTSTHISTSPEAALRTALDYASYPKWNSFTPHVSIDSDPDAVDSTPAPAANNGNGDDVLQASLPPIAHNPTDLYPGACLTLTACMSRPLAWQNRVRLEVTRVEALSDNDGRSGYRIAWKSIGQPPWLLRAERVQEFVLVAGEGAAEGTEYRCWETFGGALAWLVRLFVGGLLRRRFAECAMDLKAWCEREGA
jgi:hypothetical protein